MRVTHKPGTHGALLRAIADLKRTGVQVGFFDTAKYPDGTPVAYVATIHELGYPAGGIEARPFFRPTLDAQRDAWRDTLRRGAKAVTAGRLSAAAMLAQFGRMAAGEVSATIAKVWSPALSDRTLAARQSRKKTPGVSRKPLVDTGLMIRSVDSKVVEK